jgi:hypothetical protein
MKFRDIPKFPFASYTVNIFWNYLERWLENQSEGIMKCELDPFYQRGYIWTKKQKIAYVEYQLKGGFSGRDIFWNCPFWLSFHQTENVIQLVDGKQRIDAVLGFLHDKVPAFGLKYSEFEDKLVGIDPSFIFHVNNLRTEKEVVEWYIGMNTGGSIHTEKDLKPALDYLKQIK